MRNFAKLLPLLSHPSLALGSSILDPVAREKLSKEVSLPVKKNGRGAGGSPGEWGDTPRFSDWERESQKEDRFSYFGIIVIIKTL